MSQDNHNLDNAADRAVSLSDAAKIAGVSTQTLRSYARAGRLIVNKSPTGRYYVSEAELQRLLRSRTEVR